MLRILDYAGRVVAEDSHIPERILRPLLIGEDLQAAQVERNREVIEAILRTLSDDQIAEVCARLGYATEIL